MQVVNMEQREDGKVAIDHDSLEQMLDLVCNMTIHTVVPDDVDMENDVRVLFAKELLGLTGAYLLLALYKPDLFVDLVKAMDICEIYGVSSKNTKEEKKEVLYS